MDTNKKGRAGGHPSALERSKSARNFTYPNPHIKAFITPLTLWKGQRGDSESPYPEKWNPPLRDSLLVPLPPAMRARYVAMHRHLFEKEVTHHED